MGAAPDATRTSATREWILERLHEPLTLADMAAHAGTSTRSLSRWFVADTGTTPIQWLQAARIERACELLKYTGLTIDEVARDAGLGTRANFRRIFVEHIGVVPSKFRRANAIDCS